MAEIQWSRLASRTFEDMVACLLSHQNPKVRRIDGTGGDGGRDCQFEAPDGLHVYEMKGFSGGRVGQAQRRQVTRSLKRAARLNPVEWTLITPIDHTPAELTWFEKLGDSVRFPIVWAGKTWLNTGFAQRPFIADYYIGTTRDEVIDLLRERNSEQAGLSNGVPDAMLRIETLVKRTIDVTGSSYRISLKANWKSFVPHDFAPVARFLTAYHAPNTVVVTLADGRAPSESLECSPGLEMPVWMLDFVLGLAVIQASAGIIREVSDVTPQDVVNVAGGVALFRGAEVPAPWTNAEVTVVAGASLEVRKHLAMNAIRVERIVDAPFELNICRTVYPIGRRHVSRCVCRVARPDVDPLLADELTDDLRVSLVPDPNQPIVRISLVD